MKEKDILLKIYKLGQVIIALLLFISIVLIIGFTKIKSSDNTNTSSSSSDSEYNTIYDVSMFKEIKASDIQNETKGKLSVVFIGRETCGWCAAFLPSLWQAQDEYKYETLYVDIAKIIDFENNTIADKDAFDIMTSLTGENYDGYMEEKFGSTPMILIMKDNKILNAQNGYSEYEVFEQFLQESGFTK